MNKLIGILRLKRLLETSTDLGEPARYFWDHLAEEPTFQSAGRLGANPTLKLIIEHAATHVLGAEQTATMLLLVYIARYKFWHGACLFGRTQAQIIYYTDIGKGLLTLADDMSSGPAHYVRISSFQVDGDRGTFVVNPRVKPLA